MPPPIILLFVLLVEVEDDEDVFVVDEVEIGVYEIVSQTVSHERISVFPSLIVPSVTSRFSVDAFAPRPAWTFT